MHDGTSLHQFQRGPRQDKSDQEQTISLGNSSEVFESDRKGQHNLGEQVFSLLHENHRSPGQSQSVVYFGKFPRPLRPGVQSLGPHSHCALLPIQRKMEKPTTFLTGHIVEDDLHRLQRRCEGPNGLCSRTGLPRWPLTGSCKGVPWTKIAEPYPAQLCTALAYALTAPLHTLPQQIL